MESKLYNLNCISFFSICNGLCWRIELHPDRHYWSCGTWQVNSCESNFRCPGILLSSNGSLSYKSV